MTATPDLLALERGFWLRGAEFYREHLADEAIMVFPGTGLMRRADVIAGIERGPRWTEVKFRDETTLDLGPDSRLLCYQAEARRDADGEYSAMVSSIYVRRGGAWRLVFHQQSPSA